MSEPEITLLALLEGLAAAQRVGAPLPLAAYARAYPQHADALLAYVAALWSGDAPELASAPRARTALSAGTRHALTQLFSGAGDGTAAPERRVAEQPSEYVARAATRPESADDTDDAGGEG